MMNLRSLIFAGAVMLAPATAFIATCHTRAEVPSSSCSALHMGYHSNRASPGRSTSRYGSQDRSKRQERVGHLVRAEISSILTLSHEIKHSDHLEGELRKRISVVNVDVSPDLGQARITVSIVGGNHDTKEDAVVDQRRAYSWLVRSTKMIRHALAQRLAHMKGVPNLTFVLADVGAAVDVMQLIEKVAKGYKRENLDNPTGMVMGMDFDDDDDGDWIDEDDDDDEEDWLDEDDFDEDEEKN
eukprot:scaffold4717_cov53-Attheya_sp.AAC.1